MSLFDDQNFAEISHPDYPGERLIVCRNPALADERARKRGELLDATETELAKIVAAVTAGRLSGAGKIGLRVGKGAGKIQGGQTLPPRHHRHLTDGDPQPGPDRRRGRPRRDLHPAHHRHPPTSSDTAAVIDAYKNLSRVERDFRVPQGHRPGPAPDPPPPRRPGQGARADLHARRLPHLAPAPSVGAVDLHRRTPTRTATTPSPRRARSAAANSKAARKTTTDGDLPARSYQGLLAHLATLTRNDLHYGEVGTDRAHARRPHRHPTPSVRTPRHHHPPDPQVARTTTHKPTNPQLNRGVRHSRRSNFGLEQPCAISSRGCTRPVTRTSLCQACTSRSPTANRKPEQL